MAPPWTAVEAASENVSKKMLLAYMQENCDAAFLQTHKLGGQPNGVLKRVTKDAMVDAYKTHLGGGSKAAAADGEDGVWGPVGGPHTASLR